MRVIDFLEVVDVSHNDAQSFTAALPTRYFSLQQIDDSPAIPQSSQRIVSCGKLQIIFGANQSCLQIENPFSCTHPGAKFVYVKRLGQVIISAGFEPCDNILFIILCSEKQDVAVYALIAAADPPTKLDPVDPRHHPVE